MQAETHPWLKWPGASNSKKISLNNKLARLQNRSLSQPRIMDWEVCNRLEIMEELDELFVTRDNENGVIMEIPIWNRAFDIREDSYRELCLEFYSSIEVQKEFHLHEIYTVKLISFRLGGQEHEVTIPQFGHLAGLLTSQELGNRQAMTSYMGEGELDSKQFLNNIDQNWSELSGLPSYTSTSKIKEVRIPILRVIHKLITYSFLHRSSQNDKVYSDDLWLLHMFNQRDSFKFVNVPWVLACYMESKAAGRQRDSQICCGHFVTRIARNLRLLTQANIRMCSPALKWRKLTMHDLESSRLIAPSGNRLIAASLPPEQQQQPQQGRGPRGSANDEVFRIGRQVDLMGSMMERMGRQMDGMSGYLGYHMERYQPSMEHYAQQYASSSGTQWSPYAPPPMYPPPQAPEEEYDDDEEGDEDEN